MKTILLGLVLAVSLIGALLLATAGSGSPGHAAVQSQLTDHCVHVGLVTLCYPT